MMIMKAETKMKMIAQSTQVINMVNMMNMETKMKMIAQSPQIINMVIMMIMETLATVELFKERPLSTSSGRSMLKIQ